MTTAHLSADLPEHLEASPQTAFAGPEEAAAQQ
jgi:hypothetical protein